MIGDCTSAIRIEPRSAWAYGERGAAWSRKGEHDKAITDFSEVIRLDPKDPDAYYYRSVAWRHKGDQAKAMADYTKCIGLDPAYGLWRNGRGSVPPTVRDQTNDIGEFLQTAVLEHVSKVESDDHLDPKVVDAQAASSPMDITPGACRPGREIGRHSHQCDREEFPIAAAVTMSVNLTNNVTDAQEQVKASFADSEPGSDAFFKGDYGTAIAECSNLLERHPDCSPAYLNRARALCAKGNYTRALADLRKVIGLDPQNAYACDLAAQIQAACPDGALRDGKAAVEAATRACELIAWKKASYLDTLAAASAEAADFAAAVKWQNRAIELSADKNDNQERRRRLKLYLEKRPYRDARPHGQPGSEENPGTLETIEHTKNSTTSLPAMALEHPSQPAPDKHGALAVFGEKPVPTPFEIMPAPASEVARLAAISSDSDAGPVTSLSREPNLFAHGHRVAEARRHIEAKLGSECPGLDELARGDFDAAIEQLSEWLRVNPEAVSGYVNRAAAWGQKGEYSRALADYESAIRLDPRDANSFNAVALIRAMCPDERVRDGKKAVESATRACELTIGSTRGTSTRSPPPTQSPAISPRP